MRLSIASPWHRWAFLLAALAWLAATAWLRPLTSPDEGRYVSVAWEMLRSGKWLVPMLDGLPYFHKPPLFYWITAAALSISQDSLLAARAASWLGAALALVALAHFTLRWAGPERAVAVVVALATTPLFYLAAQFANLDMLVAGCITASVLAFAHAALLLDEQQRQRQGALLAAYAFAALGTLAKGLIGFVLPGLVIGAWLVMSRRWGMLRHLLWLPGIALFLVVVAPWFIAMQSRYPAFAHYFFVIQHFDRYASGGFNNAQPAWFYLAALAVATLPWTLWLPALARATYWRDPQRGPVRRLMGVWTVVTVLFFSLPQSKLLGYILPAAPPLLFLLSDAGCTLRATGPRWELAWRAARAAAAILCLSVAVGAGVSADKSQQALGRLLRDRMVPGDAVYFVDEYWFALPFEARLAAPAFVVADWSAAAVHQRDNWHGELADAAGFAGNTSVLVQSSEMPRRLCGPGTSWLIGPSQLHGPYAWLRDAEPMASSGAFSVWRIAGSAAAPFRLKYCGETPNPRSGGKS